MRLINGHALVGSLPLPPRYIALHSYRISVSACMVVYGGVTDAILTSVSVLSQRSVAGGFGKGIHNIIIVSSMYLCPMSMRSEVKLEVWAQCNYCSSTLQCLQFVHVATGYDYVTALGVLSTFISTTQCICMTCLYMLIKIQ